MKKTQDFKTQDARKQEEKSEDKNFDFRTQSEPVQKFDKRHGANFLVQPLNRVKLDSLAVKRLAEPLPESSKNLQKSHEIETSIPPHPGALPDRRFKQRGYDRL